MPRAVLTIKVVVAGLWGAARPAERAIPRSTVRVMPLGIQAITTLKSERRDGEILLI